MSIETKLLCACAHGNISSVKLLTEVIKCDPNTVRGIDHGETTLHVACENGNLYLVIQKYLISTYYCDPQCTCVLPYPGHTPLHAACRNGHLDIARYLITECSCDPEYPNIDGETPLHLACLNGHLDMARYLTPHYNNPECLRIDGVTPLQLACSNAQLKKMCYFAH